MWSVDVSGAVTNQQYKYFINGSLNKQDPRSRQQLSSVGNCIIYNGTNFNWAGDNFTAPSLADTVVYELNIGSFYDPNAPANPGTFANATNKLAQLKQLGVSAVEVMPISEFPGNFSWGYNPSDIFGVESSYGGPDGFKNFVKTAHQLGLAVLLDVVHNHYGPSDLDLWQFDGSFVSSGGTNFGGIYFYQANGTCCTPYGETRPDYATPQVSQFIQDNFTMWLSECHVDGFRWDSPGYMMFDNNGNFISAAQTLIQKCSAMIHTGYVGKINIGEDQGQLSGVSGFDATWATGAFLGNIEPQLATSSDSSRNMASVDFAVNLNHQSGQATGWGNVLFMEDHDSAGDLNNGQRLPVEISNVSPTGYFARKRSTLGVALTMTSAGIPMILQGEEVLTTNQFSSNDPIDWSLTNTFSGIFQFYTDLIHLRRNSGGRTSGLEGLNTSTLSRDDTLKLIAYRRWNTGSVGDDVVVIANFANAVRTNYTINFPESGTWYTQLNSDWTTYSPDYGNTGSVSVVASGSPIQGAITIAPYSVLILSQNVPGAPPTPQNFTASTGGTNQINLAWSASPAATGYVLKRSGTQIATTSATSYFDTGLTVGSNFCYTVAATNNLGGVSADSASACATTLFATSATNLLAYWAFDEAGGAIAYDSSGNGNTGTIAGATWTNGIINSALFFDGGSAQVTVPNSLSVNPVQTITIAAWVNAGNWFNTPRILEKGKTDNQYGLFVNGAGQFEFLLAGVTNGVIATSPPSAGSWHHVAATYDGSLISLYIDGQLDSNQPAFGPLAITTEPLAIGDKPSGGVIFLFYGTLDDVRIYGSALPAGQIAQLYGTDTVGDGIANWWRLQYFGDPALTGAMTCATCDFDSTGQNNLFKYVAGLDPTDPTAVFYFQIASVTNPVGQNLMFTPLALGRSYSLQYSTDLVEGAWSTLFGFDGPITNGNQITITDTDTLSTQKFYRIDIRYP